MAQETKPISHLARWLSDLNQYTHQVVSPGVIGVEHFPIPLSEADDTGYAVSYVPKSVGQPHMAIAKKKEQYCYFVRSGSSFVKMEAFMVADRFGQRPQPKLELSLEVGRLGNPQYRMFDTLPYPPGTIECEVAFGIRNVGSGIARFPAIRIKYDNKALLQMIGATFGLSRRVETDRPGIGLMFAGGVNDVVHPGSTLDVGKLLYRMTGEYMGTPTAITFEIYCEGDSKMSTASVVLAQNEGGLMTF